MWSDEAIQGDLSREPIERADGSYYFDSDIAVGTVVDDGIALWEFTGYSGFVDELRVPETFSFVAEPDLRSPFERMFDVIRVDRLGRAWRIVAVDERATEARLLAFTSEHEETAARSLDELKVPLQPSPLDVEEAGQTVTWQPQSWVHENCLGPPIEMENHTWEGEGRTPIGLSHSRQERAAIRVFGPAGTCTGTLIDNDEVLTAAHCVVDCSNNAVPFTSVTVCLDGPYGQSSPTCVGGNVNDVDNISFPPSYNGGGGGCGGTDFADDWAIISLGSPITTWTTATASLSGADDATLAALTTIRSFGMDGFLTPNCTDNTVMLHQIENEPIASITAEVVRLKIDCAPGGSGRPHYYCPEGDDNFCNFNSV